MGKMKRKFDNIEKSNDEDESTDPEAFPFAHWDFKYEKIEKMKKKKHALLLGYVGLNYRGLMMDMTNNNDNHLKPSVIDVLIKVLKELGYVEYKELWNLMLNVSSRTDKGVSATCVCVTLKIVLQNHRVPQMINNINAKLPDDIRCINLFPVGRGFNARVSLLNRTYEYICPAYSFSKKSLEDHQLSDFRLDQTQIEKIKELCARFSGRVEFNYHNFSSGIPGKAHEAKRTIHAFDLVDIFEAPVPSSTKEDKIQVLRFKIKGRSFVFHQIRKMIAYVICCMNGLLDDSEELLKKLSTPTYKAEMPVAPSLGLFLGTYEMRNDKQFLKRFGKLKAKLEPCTYPTEVDKLQKIISCKILEQQLSSRTFQIWLKTAKCFDSWGKGGSVQVTSFTQRRTHVPKWVKQRDEEKSMDTTEAK